MKEIALIFSLLLLLCSCDLSSPEEASVGEIENAFQAIELSFNLDHIEDIMQYYNQNYLHNDDDIDDVRRDWEIRLNDFQGMEISDLDIDLDGDKATVSFILKFLNNGEIVQEYNEPDDNGDISYWELETNGWEISGNRNNGW